MFLTLRAALCVATSALTLSIAHNASAQDFNANGQSLRNYIAGGPGNGNLCPELAALGTARTADENDLFLRCNAVLLGGDAESSEALANEVLVADEIASQLSTSTNIVGGAGSAGVAARLSAIASGAALASNGAINGSTIAYNGDLAQFSEMGMANDAMLDAQDQDLAVAPAASGFGVFLNASFGIGDKGEQELEGGYDFSSRSVTVGVDYGITNNLIVGVAGSYGTLELDYDGDRGESDSDAYGVLVYGYYGVTDALQLTALAGYSRIDYSADRKLDFTDTNSDGVPDGGPADSAPVDNVASSDTEADQFELAANAYYDLFYGPFTVTPFVGVRYIQTEVDEFTESTQEGSGSGLGLAFEDQSLTSFQTTLGLEGSRTFITSEDTSLTLSLRGAWIHEFDADADTVTYSYASAPATNTASATLTYEEPAEDFARFGGTAALSFGANAAGFIDYSLLAFYDDYFAHTVTVGGRIDF